MYFRQFISKRIKIFQQTMLIFSRNYVIQLKLSVIFSSRERLTTNIFIRFEKLD